MPDSQLREAYAINQVLSQCICVANFVENLSSVGQLKHTGETRVSMYLVDIVRHQAIPGPLREETGCQQNKKPAAVAFGPDKFEPAIAFDLFFDSDGVPNLDVLELNELIVLIAVGVYFGKDFETLLFLAMCDTPSGRLRNEPDETNLEQRWSGLDDSRDTP